LINMLTTNTLCWCHNNKFDLWKFYYYFSSEDICL